MDFAFGLSAGEMTVLFPLHPGTLEGRAWKKRPREQQRAAMLWVLNRLFFATFCNVPLFDREPQARRERILELCRDCAPLLQEAGWSMHDVMEWLVEVTTATCWTSEPCAI